MTAPALAAEIRDPDHGLSVAYSERLWSGTQDGNHIDFSCRIDECGGESASCRVTFFATKPGKSQADYVDDFAREFTAAAAAEFTKAGLKPEIVDPPVNFLVGSNMARLSSIRFNDSSRSVFEFKCQRDVFNSFINNFYRVEIRNTICSFILVEHAGCPYNGTIYIFPGGEQK